MPANSATTPTI